MLKKKLVKNEEIKKESFTEDTVRLAITEHLNGKDVPKRVNNILNEMTGLIKKGIKDNPSFGVEFLVALTLLIKKIRKDGDLDLLWDIINEDPRNIAEQDYIG